jgi:hypothetical protein
MDQVHQQRVHVFSSSFKGVFMDNAVESDKATAVPISEMAGVPSKNNMNFWKLG